MALLAGAPGCDEAGEAERLDPEELLVPEAESQDVPEDNTGGGTASPEDFGATTTLDDFGPDTSPDDFGPDTSPDDFGPDTSPDDFGPNTSPDQLGAEGDLEADDTADDDTADSVGTGDRARPGFETPEPDVLPERPGFETPTPGVAPGRPGFYGTTFREDTFREDQAPPATQPGGTTSQSR